MKKSRHYNDLLAKEKEWLKKEIDNLKGGMLQIRLKDIRYNKQGFPEVPRLLSLPTSDRVASPVDPSRMIDIAIIESVGANDTPKFARLHMTSSDGGYKTFNIKSGKDREIIEFMLLTDFNGAKEGRDASKRIAFETYRPEEIAESALENDLAMAEAMASVGNMSESEVMAFGAANGYTDDDHRLIRRRMIQWAKRDPADFMKNSDKNTIRVYSTLRLAEHDGLLKFDRLASQWQYKSSGESIHTFKRSSDFDPYLAFKEWMKESDEAHKIIESLEVQLGITKPKKPKPAKAES